MDALPSPVATSAPRAVPLSNVFRWFEAAMRMFKVSPWSWCALGAITLASEVALEFGSLSKHYNMTGWRIGWAAGSAEAIRALSIVKTNLD